MMRPLMTRLGEHTCNILGDMGYLVNYISSCV